MKEETVPPQRGYPKRTVLILVLVIVVLTGIVIFQQLQISYLRPIAYQETVTRNSWVGFITMFYVSQLNGALGITPSFVLTGDNLNLSQGRTVTVHGDWPQSAMSSLQVGNSMFFQVSTGGGWAASVVSINS